MNVKHITLITGILLAGILANTHASVLEVGSVEATNTSSNNYFMGRVGIGMKNPGFPLDVNSYVFRVAGAGNQNTQMRLERYSSSTTRFPYMSFVKSNSDTFGVRLPTTNTEILGAFIFLGTRPDNTHQSAAFVRSRQDGFQGSSIPGRMEFATSSSSERDQVRMTIRASGNVGIGTQDPDGMLHVAGDARFDGGISYIAPLGDLSMGSFTNSPAQ